MLNLTKKDISLRKQLIREGKTREHALFLKTKENALFLIKGDIYISVLSNQKCNSNEKVIWRNWFKDYTYKTIQKSFRYPKI